LLVATLRLEILESSEKGPTYKECSPLSIKNLEIRNALFFL
jgi:hypothetical protein